MVLPTQRIKSAVTRHNVLSASTKGPTGQLPSMQDNEAETVDDDQDQDNGLKETLIGKSLARAQQVFKESGLLGKDLSKGRNLDKSLDEQLALFKTATVVK